MSDSINPDMDRHAAAQGLGHWRCTSPNSNSHWMRLDGRRYSPHFRTDGGFPDELREQDRLYPMAVVPELPPANRITFQHPRDAAWFPCVQMPAGWWLIYWCHYIEVAIVTGYEPYECLLKIDRVPE